MSWKRYEKDCSRKHNARHIGGPGKPDYQRGNTLGEVKHRQTPVTKSELRNLHERGIAEVHSLGGFTEPAINHVQRYNMKMRLFHRGKRIV